MPSSAVRRTQLLASGLLIVTFAVGCLVGTAWDRVLSAREPAEPAPVQPGDKHDDQRDEKSHKHMINARLLNEISMTTAQRLVIDSILDIREREAKKLWREEWVPRFNAMMEQTRGQVRAQLTADQVKQLDELIEEQRAQHNQKNNPPAQQHDPEENKTEKQSAPPPQEDRETTPRRLFESIAATL